MSDRKMTCILLVLMAIAVVFSLSQIPRSTVDSDEESTELVDVLPQSAYSTTQVESIVVDISCNSVETSMETAESGDISVEDIRVGVLKRSNLTAEELSLGLFDELPKYAETFVRAEQLTGVNAVFLASIAALESSWGTSSIALSNNNLFGWTDDDGYYMQFESVEECILYVADCLKFNYLEPEGKWFEGYEITDVCIHYNGNPEWEIAVSNIMNEITERIERGVEDV